MTTQIKYFNLSNALEWEYNTDSQSSTTITPVGKYTDYFEVTEQNIYEKNHVHDKFSSKNAQYLSFDDKNQVWVFDSKSYINDHIDQVNSMTKTQYIYDKIERFGDFLETTKYLERYLIIKNLDQSNKSEITMLKNMFKLKNGVRFENFENSHLYRISEYSYIHAMNFYSIMADVKTKVEFFKANQDSFSDKDLNDKFIEIEKGMADLTAKIKLINDHIKLIN